MGANAQIPSLQKEEGVVSGGGSLQRRIKNICVMYKASKDGAKDVLADGEAVAIVDNEGGRGG